MVNHPFVQGKPFFSFLKDALAFLERLSLERAPHVILHALLERRSRGVGARREGEAAPRLLPGGR